VDYFLVIMLPKSFFVKEKGALYFERMTVCYRFCLLLQTHEGGDIDPQSMEQVSNFVHLLREHHDPEHSVAGSR
jgi:hypothetical protein